jgi:hypothetical protein
MDANLSAAVGLPSRRLSQRPKLVTAALLAAATPLTILALLVFIRRLLGAFERPAPPAMLIASALTIGVFAYVSRWLWWSLAPSRGAGAGPSPAGMQAVVKWTPSVAIVLLTIGLSWPLSRLVDWIAWVPLWIADILWRARFAAGRPTACSKRAIAGAPEAADPPPGFAADTERDIPAGATIVQHLTRFRDQEGHESVAGTLRADFAPGQRTTEVFVGFCPPFNGTPSVEVEQSSGPHARLSIPHVVSHGVRVDIKLKEPASTADTVVLDLYASGRAALSHSV